MRKLEDYEINDDEPKEIPVVNTFGGILNEIVQEFRYWCELEPEEKLRAKLIDLIHITKVDKIPHYDFRLIIQMLPSCLSPQFKLVTIDDRYYLRYDPRFKSKNSCKTSKRNPISATLRHEVLKRDDFKCVECGVTGENSELHVDHIIPVSQGGFDELDNLQTLCRECNLAKGNRAWKGGKQD